MRDTRATALVAALLLRPSNCVALCEAGEIACASCLPRFSLRGHHLMTGATPCCPVRGSPPASPMTKCAPSGPVEEAAGVRRRAAQVLGDERCRCRRSHPVGSWPTRPSQLVPGTAAPAPPPASNDSGCPERAPCSCSNGSASFSRSSCSFCHAPADTVCCAPSCAATCCSAARLTPFSALEALPPTRQTLAYCG